MSEARRIGLFGGSFDPVHVAHVALGRLAVQALALHELRWIPTGHAWQKQRRLTDAAHRVAMLRLALEGDPRHTIDPRELRREGPSYMIDTVLELRAAEAAEWFVVVGQDQYANLPTWHRWRELVPLVTWAVAGRAGEAPRPSAELAAVPHRVARLPLPPMDVSATQIRERLAAGRDIAGLVPPAVAAYIETNHLYRS